MRFNKRGIFSLLIVAAAVAVIGLSYSRFWVGSKPAAVERAAVVAAANKAASTDSVEPAGRRAAPTTDDKPPAAEGEDFGELSRAAAAAMAEAPILSQTAFISQLCSTIYASDFEQAAEQLKSGDDPNSRAVARLCGIIKQYQAIQQHRERARQQSYEEQFSKLAELRPPGQVDVNDVNDITTVLSVVFNLQESADENQKKQLLEDAFVKQIINRAIQKSAEYENKGQWLDAYIRCYYWLKRLDKENKSYSDYAEQLEDKALIKASLQDSPCETRQQRYEGITKKMFTRAIKWLDLYHVEIVDYGEMASKAVERCRLLGEVLSSETIESDLPRPDTGQITAWQVGLRAVLNDIEDSPISPGRDKFIDLFKNILALNKTTIALSEDVIVAQFAEAALDAIDRYTNLVWPWQVQNFEKNLTKEFTGIGIEITKADGPLTVASLLPDTPAYTSGLDAGDVIEAVDGLSTARMSLYCAVRKITGSKGTQVTLTVRHIGADKSEDITITRDRIIVPTIRGWQRDRQGKWRYMIDEQERIGYVNITDFAETTSPDLERVLGWLENKGLKGLVLDLRFNGGGYLDSGVAVVDKFVEQGPIVSTRRRFGRRAEKAHKAGTHPNYPLVVLVNEHSASASEIVAGALQDPVHNRAILVGARTYGKGEVLAINSHPGGGARLQYTLGHYLLPSEKRVLSRYSREKAGKEDWGVGPDVEVKLRNDETRKMLDVQRDNSVLVKAGHDSQAAPLKKHTIEETLLADPQLAVALLLVQTKLVEAEVLSRRPASWESPGPAAITN